MKPDEQRLLAAVATMHPADNVRDVIVATGINRKRAHYLLEKWSNKGWYDYGVAVDLGWLEADGYRAADELAAQMRLNQRTMRWENVDRDGNVVAWIADEVPDEQKRHWYHHLLKLWVSAGRQRDEG